MNLIFKKRLKRKKKLEGRKKCHANVFMCSKIHYSSSQLKELKRKQEEFKIK